MEQNCCPLGAGKCFKECVDNATTFKMLEDQECIDLMNSRQQFDGLEGSFLSIAATLSMVRLIYWLQLSPKIGPVVINIRRIILGMCIVYLLVIDQFCLKIFCCIKMTNETFFL